MKANVELYFNGPKGRSKPDNHLWLCVNDNIIEKVKEVVLENRCFSIREIAEHLNYLMLWRNTFWYTHIKRPDLQKSAETEKTKIRWRHEDHSSWCL